MIPCRIIQYLEDFFNFKKIVRATLSYVARTRGLIVLLRHHSEIPPVYYRDSILLRRTKPRYGRLDLFLRVSALEWSPVTRARLR